jgi:tetratricopeptide (TPR) repeat protein
VGTPTIDVLNSAVIRRWNEATGNRRPDIGPTVGAAVHQATLLWFRAAKGEAPDTVFSPWIESPDVFWALGSVIQGFARHEVRDAALAASIYRLMADIRTVQDPTEHHALCARLAFLTWNTSRRAGLADQLVDWEVRCERHSLAQDALGEFLTLNQERWSGELIQRFATTPEVMLAILVTQRTRLNRDPSAAYSFGTLAYEWVSNGGLCADSEATAHFSGELALNIAHASRFLGRFSEVTHWAEVSAYWFHQTDSADESLCKVRLLRATALYDRHSIREALAGLPTLRRQFERFGMQEFAIRTRFLEALCLGAAGRAIEAGERLEELRTSTVVRDDSLLLGLVLLNIAQFGASSADEEGTCMLLEQAHRALERAGAPFALAHFHCVCGEILRDRSRYEEAIRAYQAGIALMTSLQMEGQVAYVRIVLAETLLLAGYEADAQRELVAALPTLDREALLPDAVTAIALLRESLLRQRADPEALQVLRLQLERARQGGQS